MSHNTLLHALQNPDLYDHPVTGFRLLETHGAWVLLTGQFAYKIKKPVDFEFLDYSTLEKRLHCCNEEVRLNRALSPELYEAVIPITGTPENPQFKGNGAVIEYAIKMTEFPQAHLFSHLLRANKLTPTLIDDLAARVAHFHAQTHRATPDMSFGDPEHVRAPVQQNFDQIRPLLTDSEAIAQLDRLETMAQNSYDQLRSVFQERKQKGYIRECHGDLYLNNIILWDNRPLIFDCIEFNESFRWTDTMADIGFLAMDLTDNGRADYAYRLINRYLEVSGDYDGLAVLRYYQSYRAVVRAKVGLFRLHQPGLSAAEQTEIHEHYLHGMALAEHYMQDVKPRLIITYGVSGSGKSTRARQLVEQLGAVQIRSDTERKRLAGLAANSNSNSALNQGLYTEANTEKVYQHLLESARSIIQSNYTVVVDATFLQAKYRLWFCELAMGLNIPFHIQLCYLPTDILKTRIVDRKIQQSDDEPSEARLEVLAMQEASLEPLTDQELHYASGDVSSIICYN